MSNTKKIWYSSPGTYTYDSGKDLYEQILEIVDNKLKWYSDLLAIYEFFNYDNWKDLSLNLKYAKITTIVNPHIEEDIKASVDDEETFKRIVWHIPFFVWREPLKKIKIYNKTEQSYKEIIKKCKPYVTINPVWGDDDVFKAILHYKENNKIKKITVMAKTPQAFFSKDFLNNNLIYCKIICTGETLVDISKIFKNCQKLISVDLSECNLIYCHDMSELFKNCINLQKIDFSNLYIDEYIATNTSNMFSLCMLLHDIVMNDCDDNVKTMIKCALLQSDIDEEKINIIC